MPWFSFTSIGVLAPLQLILLFWFEPLALREGLLPLLPPEGLQARETFFFFPFDRTEDLREWQDKVIQGESAYRIEFEGNGGFVRGEAKESASAKYRLLHYEVEKTPYLTWRWRAGRFPNKEIGPDSEPSDDYPARVVVIFASHFFKNFRCLEYLWDDLLPEGTVRTSPVSDQIRQIVVRSGPGNEDWRFEERNVLEDYWRAFQEGPKHEVRAIAIMTDADSTRSVAEGFFDEIWIGSLKEKGAVA